jgi:diadenylate cyclase
VLKEFLMNIANFNNFLQFRWSIYLSDFLDIVIIAMLIYTLFLFLKSTRTSSVFMGLFIAFGLYLVAKNLNLYLTFVTLRYFVGVSLIIFVIIFRDEIRRYFEFLGLIGSRQIKVGPLVPKSPTTQEIVQACVQMAQANIGALIVIQGKDNLDSQIEGGSDLDGIITEDILYSIFDPHSDGHDGAVIISNNRISKFGAHLPLSTNFKEIGKHGTRHSAALGIAERSDVLAIVVSEEKGKLSICKEGKLKTLAQFSDLEKEIDKYIKVKFGNLDKGSFARFITHNFSLKLAAVICASIIWYAIAYQAGISSHTYNIPLVLDKLQKDTFIVDSNPKSINVTLNGRGSAVFSRISDSDIKAAVSVADLKNGANKITLSRKNIDIPANLTLESYEPASIVITAKKYYQTLVPISIKTTGTVKDGLEIKDVISTPDTLDIWVPIDSQAPTEIPTDTIDVSNFTESVVVSTKLIVPDEIRLITGDSKASVAFTVEKSKSN